MKTPDTTQSASSLLQETKEYVETRIEFATLKAIEKTTDLASSLVFIIVVALIAIALLVVISVATAYLISAKTNSRATGFFAVGGFYAIVVIAIFLFRKKWLVFPISNGLIKKMTK